MAQPTTKVVHCKKEPYDIYIGRGSKWGNPFTHKPNTSATYIVKSRNEAINQYRQWVVRQPHLMESLEELRGKALGCWCKPKTCHGDVLVELLERSDGQTGKT